MIWSASVVSTVSTDTEPTIAVCFDSAKYVFNVGENTSRAWLQGTLNWKRMKGLFLTSLDSQRGSGVPGFLMTLADSGTTAVDIVGPPGLAHYLASMRLFLYRAGMKIQPLEIEVPGVHTVMEPPPVFKDKNITVYGIPVIPEVLRSQNSQLSAAVKRKRSPSPHASSKRRNVEDRVVQQQRPTSSQSQSLIKRITRQHPPSALREPEAQEWRNLIVDSMFPPLQANPESAEGRSAASVKDRNSNGKEGKQLRPPSPTSIIPFGKKANKLPTFSLPQGQLKPTFCYVCVGPKFRGKFDAKKATELGLPHGRIRAQLAKGEVVTLMVDDGSGGKVERVIRPEECIAPAEPAQAVIILDVPSPAHIDSLISGFADSAFYRKFRSHSEDDAKECALHTVFHICGEGVLEDARYKAFMNGFSHSVYHVVSSREHLPDPVTFTVAAFAQLRLHQLDAEMFPLQKFQMQAKKNLADVSGLPPNTTAMRSNTRVDVRPPKPPAHDPVADHRDIFHPVVTGSAPLFLSPQISNTIARVKSNWAEDEKSRIPSAKPGDDVCVVPLGTSSAMPTLSRNVSSTLIQIPRWGNVLLDAGEGTWGQLARLFGDDPARSSGVWQTLRDLKCVFLSHIHGDHHLGLLKILAMRKKLDPPSSDPLYVIGLRHFLLHLQEMSDIEDLGIDGKGVITILSDALNWRETDPYRDVGPSKEEPFVDIEASRNSAADMCRTLGLKAFTTVDVDHATRCYGAVLKHSDGWSIVFSADTRPTNNLVQAGKNATLLIHEATMGDEEEEMAQAKAHSTFSQAVDIGRRMKAENILLTHFSARYPKMPQSEVAISEDKVYSVLEDRASAPPADLSATEQSLLINDPSKPVLALAFDHARIRIGEMRKLRAYLPAIEQTFAETAEKEDEEINPKKGSW